MIKTDCGCNDQGSVNVSCNSNGMCTCKDNVIGNKCEFCITGYHPFPDCNKGTL